LRTGAEQYHVRLAQVEWLSGHEQQQHRLHNGSTEPAQHIHCLESVQLQHQLLFDVHPRQRVMEGELSHTLH
ncbi:MAG TPA: hypothetical protein VHD88_05765, partial [Pyrinomonadaceae bacterium]|nr:hypothetical protein [Pyrinomonadaceae bacterium]